MSHVVCRVSSSPTAGCRRLLQRKHVCSRPMASRRWPKRAFQKLKMPVKAPQEALGGPSGASVDEGHPALQIGHFLAFLGILSGRPPMKAGAPIPLCVSVCNFFRERRKLSVCRHNYWGQRGGRKTARLFPFCRPFRAWFPSCLGGRFALPAAKFLMLGRGFVRVMLASSASRAYAYLKCL